jgi:hypothetical protein
MPLNGKFIEKYGKAWLSMDDGERQMAIMSEIFDLRESADCLPKVKKDVDRLKWTIFGIGVVISTLYTLVSFHLFGK